MREPRAGDVCLFLHIPKTAGTTLKHCISEHYAVPGYRDRWFVDGVYYVPDGIHKPQRARLSPRVRATLARADLRVVTGHFTYGLHEAVPRPSFYVTVVRDPVDRVVSLYHHIVRKQDERYHDAIVSRGATLEEFVADFRCREVDNDQTRRIAGVEPPFGRCTERTIERAKRNLRDAFAFVGTTERFDESLIALKRLLHWPYTFYLPALVNGDRPVRGALPRETVELVSAYNEHDLALYGYANELLDERIAASGAGFAEEVERFRAENDRYIERVAVETAPA